MRDYIKDAFGRTNLRQIRSFLIYGIDENDVEDEPYKVRLKNGSNPIYTRLNEIYPDETERDKAAADLA